MQRLIYSIFISFFLISSCAKSKPNGVVSENKIIEVLTEVSILDGYLGTLPADSAKRVMPVLYEKIFEKFDLDSTTFVKNLDYYFADPNLTEKIYTVVNTNLGNYEREFHVEDSIRNAYQQDSIQRAYYLQRLYSRQENLRYYAAPDTGFVNYYAFSKRWINNSNFDFLNNYLNLSPVPNLNILNPDSIAKYAANYKSPFIFVDTVKNKTLDSAQYKIFSKDFIQQLKVSIPSGNILPKSPYGPSPQMPVDNLPVGPQPVPVDVTDSVRQPEMNDSNRKLLDERRKLLENDQLVKPVKRQIPQ